MPTHATIRLEDNDLICSTARLRRATTRSIARIGPTTDLIAWAFPDNHGHLAFGGAREQAGHTAWRIELAIQAHRPTGASPFLRRWLRSDDDYGYLERMTRYALRQHEHHGIQSDPFGEGDCRVDILGLRVIAPWVRRRVRERLPRLSDGWIADQMEVDLPTLRAWAEPLEVEDGLEHLPEALQATYALDDLSGSVGIKRRAKTAAILACAPTVRPGRLATLLRSSRATVWRVRSGGTADSVDLGGLRGAFHADEVRAVAVQARWRARWEARTRSGIAREAATVAARW